MIQSWPAIVILALIVLLVGEVRAQSPQFEDVSVHTRRPYEISVGGTAWIEKYDLTGSGLNAAISNKIGYEGHAGFLYTPNESDLSIMARGRYAHVSFSNLTGVTPTSPSETTIFGSAGVTVHPFSNPTARFIFAVSTMYRTATETTPNAVVSGVTSVGPTIGGGWGTDFSEDFDFDIEGTLYVPAYYKEKTPSSGEHIFTVIPEVVATFGWQATTWMKITVGLGAIFEYSDFDNTGVRGSVNAAERRVNYEFPVGATFSF
jgi:hypothetical protein